MLENFVAYVIQKYGPIKGKKVFQKIFYFLTEMGIPTKLRYSLYHYGPYSSELESKSSSFESSGAICINKEGVAYCITEAMFTKAYANSKDINMYTKQIDDIITKLPIENPLKLELYSIVHYANKVVSKIYDIKDINAIVKEVESVKKSKFSKDEIIEAYEYLINSGFIN